MRPSRTFYTAAGVSLVVHGLLAGFVTVLEPQAPPPVPQTVTITSVSIPSEPPPAPPEAPAAAAPAPRKIAKAPKASPQPAPTTPAAAAAVPDFGVQLTGAVGQGGIAVPVGDSLAPPRPRKSQHSEPADTGGDCVDGVAKARPIHVPQPAYPDSARAEGLEGKVRVELTLDESGAVANARVLSGLGSGLDEAALEAVRAGQFEPATRCGTPVASTFVIAIRFTL